MFRQLDTDNNGTFSKEEMLEGYKYHMSELDAELEVEEILSITDIDGSGEIDFTEFIMTTMDSKSS